jgi:hypothetical protein
MTRIKSTPFELKLIRQQKDKDRTERVNTLHHRIFRIFTLAELSEHERKRGLRLAILSKQLGRQQKDLDEDELDNQSNNFEEEKSNLHPSAPKMARGNIVLLRGGGPVITYYL